jgi:hypothetical protein
MKNSQQTEPPSLLAFPLFMIGQDSRGNWVVQDQSGVRGGLFIDRAEALRFVRFENGNRPQAFVAVSGIFELDMMRATNAPHRQPAVEPHSGRKAA